MAPAGPHGSRRRGACHRARVRATRWRLLTMRGWNDLAEGVAQLLRHLEQRRIVLHQTLGAVEARHDAGGELAALAERNEAVEDRFVVLAEQPLVVVRPDAEIEGAIILSGVLVDDVAHQDQAGAVFRARRHRVGVEHHRKPKTDGPAGEDRDYYLG